MNFRTSPLFVVLAVVAFAAESGTQTVRKPVAPPSPAPGFATSVKSFLSDNCYSCHNDKTTSGNLDLTQFTTGASVGQNRARWELILHRIKAGEMPPAFMPRPEEAALAKATQWLEGEMARLDKLAPPDPGRVTARRLNRAEYNNTVNDLLGVDYKPADDFPQDDAGYGFDNNGDVLSISLVQMEKYLAAAETVARTAVYGPQSVKPMMARFQPVGRRRPGDPDNLFFNTHPWLSMTDYDETGLSMPNALHVTYRFPATGDYVLRATPDNGNRPAGSEALEIGFFIDGKLVGSKFADGSLEANTQEVKVRVTEGEHWVAVGFPRQFEGLPAVYGSKNPSKRPVPPARGGGRGGSGGRGVIGFSGAGGRGILAAGGAGFSGRGRGGAAGAAPAGGQPAVNADIQTVEFSPPGAPPGVRLARPDNMGVQSLEIGGPQNPEIHPSDESLRKIFICKADVPGCDRRIVAHLARLAFRRPVTTQETDTLMAQAARAKARGDSFNEQIVLAIEAMLVSPKFLFRIEQDPGPKNQTVTAGNYRLNDYELASRLSYFMWSSMPDDELLHAADQGLLRQTAGLNAQVRRMLKDPKMDRFVENFGGQWLQIRELESHKPDFYKYPLFDEYLRMSMVKETQLFFGNIIREDRTIMDFIDADYTFVNEYLGQYYGLRDVKGPDFRKASLASTNRRGLLGQASVLTASSYPNRTSVVLRGKWVLENLLNAPPPPPPPNVPNLDDAKIAADATLRERMDAHRNNAICASCHSRMDPIGFGLENFDAVGNWREKDGKTIDASGTLPDGRTFHGPVELTRLLREDGDAFARCLAEKMTIYALGRGLEPYDKPAIDKMVAGLKTGQYRFSSLVTEIADSMPFQMRKAVPVTAASTKDAGQTMIKERKKS